MYSLYLDMFPWNRYNQPGPQTFVSLWLQVLTNMSDWSRDPCILYLLDIVLKTAFIEKESRRTANELLRNLFQVCILSGLCKCCYSLLFINSNQSVTACLKSTKTQCVAIWYSLVPFTNNQFASHRYCRTGILCIMDFLFDLFWKLSCIASENIQWTRGWG